MLRDGRLLLHGHCALSTSMNASCGMLILPMLFCCFFFSVPATTEIYTLSLHDALPISRHLAQHAHRQPRAGERLTPEHVARSEEHTSELQSRRDLVCRLLLEKKKKTHKIILFNKKKKKKKKIRYQ